MFGHRPYVGVSASVIAAEQLPGWDVDDIVRASLGDSRVDSLLPMGRPPLTGGLLGPAAKAVVIKRALALLRHLKADTQEYVAAATAEHLDAAQLISLSDAQLQVRIRLLRDRIHQGWGISGRWLIDSAITAATVGRAGLQVAVSGIGALLESDAIAAETSSLAALIRGDEQLCALALERDLDGISAQSADHRCGVRLRGQPDRAPRSGRGRVGQPDVRRRSGDVAGRRRACRDRPSSADVTCRVRGEAVRTDGGQCPGFERNGLRHDNPIHP